MIWVKKGLVKKLWHLPIMKKVSQSKRILPEAGQTTDLLFQQGSWKATYCPWPDP